MVGKRDEKVADEKTIFTKIKGLVKSQILDGFVKWSRSRPKILRNEKYLSYAEVMKEKVPPMAGQILDFLRNRLH